jgi:hypothetical protein
MSKSELPKWYPSDVEGEQVLAEMFRESGFNKVELDNFTIHQEEPYLLHTDVIVASGLKENGQ